MHVYIIQSSISDQAVRTTAFFNRRFSIRASALSWTKSSFSCIMLSSRSTILKHTRELQSLVQYQQNKRYAYMYVMMNAYITFRAEKKLTIFSLKKYSLPFDLLFAAYLLFRLKRFVC